MSLGILIGTYNRKAMLGQCLESLMGKVRTSHEIVVVDAGSTDGTQEYLTGLKCIRTVFDGERLGQARSLNRVLRTLSTEYVCWLSDDNIVQEGMLDLAVSILDSQRAIGMVALKTKDMTGSLADRPYIGGIWPSGVLNCNQGVVRTGVLREVGGFCETLMSYGIDPDLTTKVLLLGYEVVYTKRVAILHYRDRADESSWATSADRVRLMEDARAVYRQRYRDLLPVGNGRLVNTNAALNSWTLSAIRRVYAILVRLGLSPDRWPGCGELDWRNTLGSRFVSNVDAVLCIGKPYHLVQRIPKTVRQCCTAWRSESSAVRT